MAMRVRPSTVGLIVVLLGGAATVGLWFARPSRAVRYFASDGKIAASLALDLHGLPAPAEVTIDLGGGARLTARRVP